MILVNIGRKSSFCLGTATLGIGRMVACFRCCGTADTAIERLNSVVICLENTGAPTRRNQAGSVDSEGGKLYFTISQTNNPHLFC